MNASGLEGGTYPGVVNILTNDPAQPDHPDRRHAARDRRAGHRPSSRPSIDYGDRFLTNPHTANLIVANDGTDVLHVTDILSQRGRADRVARPSSTSRRTARRT